jgi:hypothetical protein
MAEQQKQSLCPRLIDYLAIVGARSGTVQRAAGSNNNQPPVQVSEYFAFPSNRLLKLMGRETIRVKMSTCTRFDDVLIELCF